MDWIDEVWELFWGWSVPLRTQIKRCTRNVVERLVFGGYKYFDFDLFRSDEKTAFVMLQVFREFDRFDEAAFDRIIYDFHQYSCEMESNFVWSLRRAFEFYNDSPHLVEFDKNELESMKHISDQEEFYENCFNYFEDIPYESHFDIAMIRSMQKKSRRKDFN